MATYTNTAFGTHRTLNSMAPALLGRSRVLATVSFSGGITLLGRCRVENASKEGWVVYIGEDDLPDFSAAPADESATLPINIVITPPGAGLKVFYVVVRKRNEYGLESQNQYPTIITVDDNGDLVMNEIPPPVGFFAVARSGGLIRILAKYPSIGLDDDPADRVAIWIDTVQPLISDPTTALVEITDTYFMHELGTYSPDTYYVMIALHRTADGEKSAPVTVQLVIPAVPTAPGSVHGGWEEGEG